MPLRLAPGSNEWGGRGCPPPYIRVSGSTSITSAVAPHLCSWAKARAGHKLIEYFAAGGLDEELVAVLVLEARHRRFGGAKDAQLLGRRREQHAEFGTQPHGHFLLLGAHQDIGHGAERRIVHHAAEVQLLFDLRTLEQIARLMGRDREVAKFAEQSASVQAAFDQAHFATTSQTALAMSSVLGLSASADAIAELVADIRRRNSHTSAGDIGYH